jgi:hypothetical protein
MNPRLGVCIAAASAAIIAALTGCNYGTTSTSATPTPIPTSGPDTLYVQSSKVVLVYKHASVLNGVAFASSTLPTSDVSNPDIVYSPTNDVLWYPSANPHQTPGPAISTPIEVWTAASTKNGMNPDQLVPYTDGQGAGDYDSVHDLFFVSNTDGPVVQVYANAHLMTSVSLPATNLTLKIIDGGIAGTPRPQEMLYDPVNDRLFVSDYGTAVAVFDAFGSTAQSAAISHTNMTLTANRTLYGLFSPNGMAYAAATDTLFVAEPGRKQLDVIHNAGTKSGPVGHAQTISSFSTGPTGLAYDNVRDLLFAYDPLQIWVIPAPGVASGPVNDIVNRRAFFDSAVELVGFGLAVDTTH